MVDIIIPIYKETPNAFDVIAIDRVFQVLNEFSINFVHPTGLNTEAYRTFGKADFIDFDPNYFKGIYGYNLLMLSKEFYERFSKKYILIYQTDAFVFKNDLDKWLSEDYDYIGAPWLGRFERNPLMKKMWDFGLYNVRKLLNYKGIGKFQKNKSLLYNQVGNGGFSLRKREKFIEIINKIPEVIQIYLQPEISGNYFAEDVFYSIEPERHGISFTKPDYRQACAFSIENKPEKAKKIIENKLPFGCHRWTQQKDFWRQDFENLGYKI